MAAIREPNWDWEVRPDGPGRSYDRGTSGI